MSRNVNNKQKMPATDEMPAQQDRQQQQCRE
jgi:hypothetical protein